MISFVALLRAINVGRRQLPMAELRVLCEELGFARPRSYVASGNLILDAAGDAASVRTALEPAIEARFGFPVDVIVRGAGQWASYRAGNPFADDPAALAKMVHLCVSRDVLQPGAADAIAERASAGERVVEAAGALWIDFGEAGVAGSKITPRAIDKAAGSPTTTRNWNTVVKLDQMLRGGG